MVVNALIWFFKKTRLGRWLVSQERTAKREYLEDNRSLRQREEDAYRK